MRNLWAQVIDSAELTAAAVAAVLAFLVWLCIAAGAGLIAGAPAFAEGIGAWVIGWLVS